jgi:hypothetical protein
VTPRYLAIVERAYRGAVEEQYAHIIAATIAFGRIGCATDLLLRGNAVLYAIRGQPEVRLTIGATRVEHLPRYDSAIGALLQQGASVHVYETDCQRLGIDPERLISGVAVADLGAVARLIDSHDAVWHW